MPALLARREEIAVKLKALGFTYVTLDLSGYRMGILYYEMGEGGLICLNKMRSVSCFR